MVCSHLVLLVESGAEQLFAFGYLMSRGAWIGTLVGSIIGLCADTEGSKYAVGEYSKLASATGVTPAPRLPVMEIGEKLGSG